WKRAKPVLFQSFMQQPSTRRRYWARSLLGWRHFQRARPNDAHHALAQLEREDRVEALITQNVDGLHQAAGSQAVIDLHGRLDFVRCMACGHRMPREALQAELVGANQAWADLDARMAPDGDADLETRDLAGFQVPDCPACGGILKPDVVFFGECVPAERVTTAMRRLEHCDAL